MLWALPNLTHNLWNYRQNPPRKYIIFYAQKNFSKIGKKFLFLHQKTARTRAVKPRYLDEERGDKNPTDRSVLVVRENPTSYYFRKNAINR